MNWKPTVLRGLTLAIVLLILTAWTGVDPSSYVQAQSGAVVKFSPQTQTIKQGQTLSTTILVDTHGETIRRVLFEVTYPRQVLTARSLDQTDSVLDIWYQQDITSPGKVILEGEIPGAGTSGDNLIVTKINFDSLRESDATLSFATTSEVLRASDGANILVEARSVTYSVSSVTPTPVPTFGGSTPALSQTPTVIVVTATPTPTLSLSTSPTTSVTLAPTGAPIATGLVVSPTNVPIPTPFSGSNNRQTVMVVVVGLLIGGGIGAGAYYWLKKSKHSPNESTNNPTSSAGNSPPSPTGNVPG